MKITDIHVYKLTGEEIRQEELFESSSEYILDAGERRPHEAVFTEIITDEGLSGFCYGGSRNVLELGQLLIGEDPVRIEYLWEKMSNAYYARFGHIHDIGILDLSLWDLFGKIHNEPVYRLLGGNTRTRVPAYAAMLGFSLDPSMAADRSSEYVENGFTALKWYPQFNETHGDEGIKKIRALVDAIRKAVGPDVKLLLDFGNSRPYENSAQYMMRLAKSIEEYGISWLEEPLNFDDVDAYQELSSATSIPLACGERLYTILQLKAFLQSGAVSVYQCDPYFASGLTNIRKMLPLVASYGRVMIPHANQSCIQTAHLLFATPAREAPMAEYGVKLNQMFQHFFKNHYAPVKGFFELPDGPGFGFQLDPDKIRQKENIYL